MNPVFEWLRRWEIEPSQLSLGNLRKLPAVHEFLTASICGPAGFRYFYSRFKLLTVFAAGLYSEGRHPAFNRCWDELQQFYLDDIDELGEATLILGWMFCDFPFGPNGETVLGYFASHVERDIPEQDYQLFVEQFGQGRMGLYEAIGSTRKFTKFRELVTGRVVNAVRSVEGYEHGEVFLTRMVEHHGKVFQFCDPKCFPPEYKRALEENLRVKVTHFYFEGASDEAMYERFMKLAGPYWFSCVDRNLVGPILSPDHYRTYLRDWSGAAAQQARP